MNEVFRDRAKLYFKEKADDFLELLKQEATQGFFLNTRKAEREEILKEIDFPIETSELTNDSFYHNEDNIGKTRAYELGLIYPQEIAASLTVRYAAMEKVKVIVDLCAAPGGKTIGIMNRMNDDSICISNDVNHTRAQILSSNLERLGLDQAIVTSKEVSELADQLEDCADLVILDAPCSGEGMIRKYPEILEQYSLKNISDLSSIQKDLLRSAYRILKKGGQLIYSTCTYAQEEDEDQVLSFLKDYPDMKMVKLPKIGDPVLEGTIKLSPLNGTEGQFICLMKKDGDPDNTHIKLLKTVKDRTVEAFLKENLDLNEYYLYAYKDRFYLSLSPLPDLGTHVLRYGICVGELKNGRPEPSHSLYRANSLIGRYRYSYDLNPEEYDRYIQGLELKVPLKNGFYQVTYHGHSLGFGKLSNGTLKNKYPKGLRRVI